MVAHLLYIMNRSRPDLDPAVSLLTTRVLDSDIEDWGTLRSILKFVHWTLKEK